MINGAERLKQLAACVNEIRQSDGSIVKEYILNDPKIIEQIKSQIKSNGSHHSNNGAQQEQAPANKSVNQPTSCPSKGPNFNSQPFGLLNRNEFEPLLNQQRVSANEKGFLMNANKSLHSSSQSDLLATKQAITYDVIIRKKHSKN
jgi:hypothetical protein